MKSKEYIAMKNFLHNELKISKKDINSLITEVIEDEVKIYLKRFFESNDKDFLNKVITEEIVKIFNSNYSSTKTTLLSILAKEIANSIKITIKS